MEPVVNGLKQDYLDQVDFRLLDVNGEGKPAFNAYRLLGHPSYVILNPSGDVVWTSIGEKTREDLENQILSALETK
jgi:hypothetical protein